MNYENILVYSALNIAASIEKKDVKLNYPGMIIYTSGEAVYSLYRHKSFLLPGNQWGYQELIFHLLWQTTFNSMIYNNNAPLFLDALLVLSTHLITRI